MTFPIEWVRSQFPALKREIAGKPVVFCDGPAGSQVPQQVADAVNHCLLHTNANHGAPFATSAEADAMLEEAQRAIADFFGTGDPDCVSFGANMTTITLSVSRALAKLWEPGDEIIVSRLCHDANFTPWKLAAEDAGAVVRHVDLHTEDWTMDLDDFASKLNSRTRLVAVGYAANGTGTINPVAQICEMARNAGAMSFVDAVHYAPHGPIDVEQIDCDFLVASAYKFFGPHVAMLFGKRDLLESVRPYKLRPSPDSLPGRWATGTQNHEGIAGALAAVNYLAELGRQVDPSNADRRAALGTAFREIVAYEHSLSTHFISGLEQIPGVTIHGIQDADKLHHRVPTVSITVEGHVPFDLCKQLGARGVFCWSGNHYALPFTEAAGLEPGGTLRIGMLHYNTLGEIDRVLAELASLI